MKTFLSILTIVFVSGAAFAQFSGTPTLTNASGGSTTCFPQGASLNISFSNSGFSLFNTITVELSTPAGTFPGTDIATRTVSVGVGFGFNLPSNLTAGGSYVIRLRASDGPISNSTAPFSITDAAPQTFGSGKWNVNGFNSSTVGTNYVGFYTENGSGASGYDFNTTTRWASGSAPSTANATNGNAWSGCPMNSTLISLNFKRTGFACGMYTINVPAHDDGYYLIINGTTVASNPVYNAAPDAGVWTGVLGSSSQVELQLVQDSGGSGLQVTFTPVATPASTSIWLGGTSTDWATGSNWCGGVPSNTISALIPTANQLNMPIITAASSTVKNVTIGGPVNATTLASGAFISAIPAASLTTAGTSRLAVFGNWANNGTYTANSGMISLFAGAAQTVTGSTTFYNLDLSNSMGATISSGTQQVSNILSFSTSNVLTVAPTATLNFLNNASATGLSNSSFVNGVVTKIGNTAFTFPVGSGSFYRPISISAPTNLTDVFTAQYFPSSANALYPLSQRANPPIDHVSAKEYWILNRTAGSSNVRVTLSFNSNSGVSSLSDLLVARWDAATSKWQSEGNGGTTVSTVTSLAGGVSTFSTPNSPFTLASTNNKNALPIELTNFSCAPLSGQVNLTWSTASELNNSYFTLERSLDGVSFTKIGTVSGSGTTSVAHNYSFVDTNPLNGTSYYRLSQTDFDGTQTSFEIRSTEITVTASANVLVYPNPAIDRMTIKYENIGKVLGVRLLSSLGVEVPISYTVNDANIEVNVSSQPSGLYVIELKTDQELVKYKIVIANKLVN